jgi:hypothetical protein
MCRSEVDIEYDSDNNLDYTEVRWDVIEKEDINKNEFLEELDSLFVDSFQKLITY